MQATRYQRPTRYGAYAGLGGQAAQYAARAATKYAFNYLKNFARQKTGRGRAVNNRRLGTWRPPSLPTTYRKAKRIRRGGKTYRTKFKRIKNKGDRRSQILSGGQFSGYKAFQMSNKALTNLLTPLVKEVKEKTLNDITGLANVQTLTHYEHATIPAIQSLYAKSRDYQNIAKTTLLSHNGSLNQWFKLCSMKNVYRIQNTSNFTVTLKLIEYRYKNFSNKEIDDQWSKDHQAQFFRDAETTPNGQAISKSTIGENPFARGNRHVYMEFTPGKSSIVTLEPGQTLTYTVIVPGRAINMSDLNESLTETGIASQYGPFTQGLMLLSRGQLAQDSVTGSTGYGKYELAVVRHTTTYYRAQLEQKVFGAYKSIDDILEPFSNAQEKMDLDGDVELQTEA